MSLEKEPDPETLYGAWYYVYGKGSHMNLAGKIIIGIPLAPFFFAFIGMWLLLNLLFKKENT